MDYDPYSTTPGFISRALAAKEDTFPTSPLPTAMSTSSSFALPASLAPEQVLRQVPLVAGALVLIVTLYLAIPYFTTHGSLRKYNGPVAARITRLWLAKQVRRGNRSEVVHQQHEQYGTPESCSLSRHSAKLSGFLSSGV